MEGPLWKRYHLENNIGVNEIKKNKYIGQGGNCYHRFELISNHYNYKCMIRNIQIEYQYFHHLKKYYVFMIYPGQPGETCINVGGNLLSHWIAFY